MSDSESDHATQEDFASVWEQVADSYDYLTPSRGDIRKGTILSKQGNEILIDIGAKQDAIVSNKDFQRLDQKEVDALEVGDEVNVYVVRADDREDALIVSINLARAYEDWLRAEALLESGEIVEVAINGHNKGGLVCSFGQLQGFIPASQVANLGQRARGATHMDSLANMVGQRLPIKVIEVNRRRRRLILSERAAQREWRAAQRERLLAELREGEVRKGTVSNLCDFGAFVDLGGVDGLVHISELAWERVNHPSEVVQPGDEIEVYVLRVDQERQRIGLSLKQLQADPWESVAERYQAGQIIQGRVTHLAKFGAFVELEPGIEGLVHLSELDDSHIDEPSQVVNEGEEISVLVLSVDSQERQVSLSLRQAPQMPPVVDESEETPEHQAATEDDAEASEEAHAEAQETAQDAEQETADDSDSEEPQNALEAGDAA